MLHMTMSYKPQVAQVNEKSFRKLFLNLTLTQQLDDKSPKL
jgi:hypothetical protein